MRVLILACGFVAGAAWQYADTLQSMFTDDSGAESPAELAPAVKIAPSRGEEELVSRTAMMDEVHQKFVARDFAWLDAKERSLREERARTNDGVWKLELYYSAVGQDPPSANCSGSADELLAGWRKASPNSPAPFIASAQRSLDIAWRYRGSGSAREVNAAAWTPFHENVGAAYEMLAQSKAIASKDPQYYDVMAAVYVAQARPEKEFRELVNEGAAREPYYYPLYNEIFRYYQPQWMGSADDGETAARFAVEQTHHQDRTSAYARVFWRQMSCGCLDEASPNLKALRTAMHDLVELYPTAWNVSHMARMACEIGDGKLARSYFEVLPAGDDGRSGWNSGSGTNTTKYRECRSTAGYTS